MAGTIQDAGSIEDDDPAPVTPGRGELDTAVIHQIEHLSPPIWLWRRVVGACYAFIVVVFAWYLLKLPPGLISDAVLPTLTQVSSGFHELRLEGVAGATLGGHLMATLGRLAVGTGFGLILGAVAGWMSAAVPLIRTVVDPVAAGLRMIPGLILGPLVVAWLGAGELAIVVVIGLAVAWTSAVAASDSRAERLRAAVIGPDVGLAVWLARARSTLLVAWTTVLTVETVLASTGLGAMVWFAQTRIDLAVAGMIVAGLIGFGADTVLRGAFYLVAWSQSPHRVR